MPSSVDLDLVRLRSERNKEVSPHILELLRQYDAISVCNALLKSVESELIPARVFSIFLSATKTIDCITACLYQLHSIEIRKYAIKLYAKALADVHRWKEAWESMGSTAGVLKYLSTVSVDEVESFCYQIGRCNTGRVKFPERAAIIEDLAKAMNPALYPDASNKTPDKRPLEKFAALLVPSCSSAFIKDLMKNGADEGLYGACSKYLLLKGHETFIFNETIHTVMNNKSKPTAEDTRMYLSRFVYVASPIPADGKHFSSSMTFSERLLEQRLNEKDVLWPQIPSESDIYFRLLKRCSKRNLPKQKLHSIFGLGVRLLEGFHSKLRSDFIRRDKEFWLPIKRFWGKWPEHWEDLLVKGLQLGLAGSGDISNSFIKLADDSKIKEDRTWELLRLICLYLPKEKVDIDTAKDLKALGNQTWSFALFGKLKDEKKIILLKLLLRAKSKSAFLTGVPSDSILTLSSVDDQYNFNALLFLTQVQSRSPHQDQRAESYKRATEACENLQRRSGSSRDQQDRATYAKASGLFAIASGSLELYGNHVTWLGRFVRDPLTMKVVFGKPAIASRDGSDLLSGIPASITDTTKLSDISNGVSEADSILLKFHEHHQVGKREPFYQEYDWYGLRDLLRNAVQTRIKRAEDLSKTLEASQGELYSHLWSRTFAMFSQVGSLSLVQVRNLPLVVNHADILQIEFPMSELLVKLPPKLLASVTQTMLETDDKYRAKKGEGKEVEDESRAIERLTYRCLLALASGNNPTLAEELVVRTVISRPDAASWHRQLLGLDFFKRLPAKNAEHLLLNFAKAIGEKLEEQSYVRVGEAANTPSIVKVTTVKYLAQILQNAPFLSPAASIDVLIELFKVATHQDIRLATLESMLATLNSLASSELQGPVYNISEVKNPFIRKILSALDAVVPVAGSINERLPPKEQDWAEAEEDTSKLPQPSENRNQRPLWAALIHATNATKYFKTYFYQHLLLPSLEVSISEHRRWLLLFLKKHKVNFSIDTLPSVIPASQDMLRDLVATFPQLVPEDIFNGWNIYVKFLIKPPMSISKFAFGLEADDEKRNKVDVKHFLNTFICPMEHTVINGTGRLITLIHHDWKPSMLPGQQGITLEHVQEAILEQIRVVLLEYDQNVPVWNSLVQRLRHPTDSAANFERWKEDCRPLLKRVISMIDDVRTPQWLADPNRKPLILPSNTRPRLWILDYPGPGVSQAQSDAKCQRLGHDVVELLRDKLSDRTSIFMRSKLTKDIMTVSEKLNNRESIQVGTFLGNFETIEEMEESLRVELAISFVADGRQAFQKDAKLKHQVATMFKKWQRSRVEEVRERVLDLVANDGHGRLWDAVFHKN